MGLEYLDPSKSPRTETGMALNSTINVKADSKTAEQARSSDLAFALFDGPLAGLSDHLQHLILAFLSQLPEEVTARFISRA